MRNAAEHRRWIAVAAVLAVLGLGLVLFLVLASTPLEALKALCGGRKATIASNDRLINGTRGPDVIVGGPGPNAIRGGRGNDLICGGYGRDRIDGGRGKDTIDGKKNRDFVRGGRGSDELDGGAGSDRVRGDSGNDAVRGGPGRGDDVDGGMGDDTVEGGRGSFDTVTGGIGRDRIDGGPGSHDLASYRNAGGPIEVDLEGGRVSGAENERLVGIEDVVGGAGSVGCLGPFPVVQRCGPSTLAVFGGDGADNLVVRLGRDRYLVSGSSGMTFQPGGAGRVRSILVSLGAGDDAIAFARSVPRGVEITVDGGPGSDWLRGGRGRDTLYGGDDGDPDRLEGKGGDDALFGVNILHPRRSSGAAAMLGGGGDDLLIGGQPCEGDLFAGGRGDFDSASFARVRNGGIHVRAQLGGRVVDPEAGGCTPGRITRSTEKIEGSTGADILVGSHRANVLLGRGGADRLDGRGREDRCIGGRGGDRIQRCEYARK